MRHCPCAHKQKKQNFHAKTTVNRQRTQGAGHIPICTHVPNLHVPKHIGRPMSGLFEVECVNFFALNIVQEKSN